MWYQCQIIELKMYFEIKPYPFPAIFGCWFYTSHEVHSFCYIKQGAKTAFSPKKKLDWYIWILSNSKRLFLIFVDMAELNTEMNCISLECGKTPIFVNTHNCSAFLHPLCSTTILGKALGSFMYIIQFFGPTCINYAIFMLNV